VGANMRFENMVGANTIGVIATTFIALCTTFTPCFVTMWPGRCSVQVYRLD
jgi:hypothetical protein